LIIPSIELSAAPDSNLVGRVAVWLRVVLSPEMPGYLDRAIRDASSQLPASFPPDFDFK
jgi:hypothetical protein